MLKNIVRFIIASLCLTCNLSSGKSGVSIKVPPPIDVKLIENVTDLLDENYESASNREIASKLVLLSVTHSIPLDIYFALIETESGWNEYAYNSGARGWGQLVPSTAAKYDNRIRKNPDLLYIPKINAIIIMRHLIDLKSMYNYSKEISPVLYSYNSGKLTKKPSIRTHYINTIMGRSLKYRTRLYDTTTEILYPS